MIEIKRKEECCGCNACANICPHKCIKMREDEEGFLYPYVDKTVCVDCKLCEKVCPVLNYSVPPVNIKQKAVIVQHKDKDICSQSTSGGAFTGIAEYVINNGGVVFGAEMDDNFRIHHVSVDTVYDLSKFRNSKYVQSNTLDTYKSVKELLDRNRLVCYSGTPCQIEGLLHYLRKDYENLILVDVVCRAAPSPGVWRKYKNHLDIKCGTIENVRFRDKSLGYQYSTMAVKNKDGKIFRNGSESDPWLRMFLSGMIIRPSCTKCQFRNRYRRSDFTVWDCFDVYNYDKKFDEKAGSTRVLIHTSKAEKIFSEIQNNYNFKFISADDAVNNVRELSASPLFNVRREEFFTDYKTLSMDELIQKYFPETFKVKIRRCGRRFLNSIGADRIVKRLVKKIKR